MRVAMALVFLRKVLLATVMHREDQFWLAWATVEFCIVLELILLSARFLLPFLEVLSQQATLTCPSPTWTRTHWWPCS